MVQILFYLRFRSQLRRTRPELVSGLEETINKAVAAAGGHLDDSRRLLSASFDGNRIGFWLDMLLLVEGIQNALKNIKHELQGHALVLGCDIQEQDAEKLCRSLSQSALAANTGIWCSSAIRKVLQSYCNFEDPPPGPELQRGTGFLRRLELQKDPGPLKDYGEFRDFRSLAPEGYWENNSPFSCRDKIIHALDLRLSSGKAEGNILLLGPPFIGKRDAVYHYCASLTEAVPPLILRLNSGVSGLACFADALTPQLRTILEASGLKKELNDLDVLAELLFKERLRDLAAPFIIEEGRRFLTLLLDAYSALVRQKSSKALIILEDLPMTNGKTGNIFREVFSSLKNREEFLIIGISSVNGGPEALASDNTDSAGIDSGMDENDAPGSENTDAGLKEWSSVFSRIIRFSLKDFTAQEYPDMPPDLWELAYAFSLLRQYFPAFLFPLLFEEEGLNTHVLDKALELLSLVGIIDSTMDPEPRIPDFLARAEEILGDRKEKVKTMVRKRLLAWEASGRISPCFNMLRILHELGEKPGDALILRSLRGDIFNETCEGIEEALAKKQLKIITGTENTHVYNWIYRTLKALVHKKPEEIRKAFLEVIPVLPANAFPGYRAQVQANLSAYRIGIRDLSAASETVKELMHLNQGLMDGSVPSYRFFSLLNLCKQRPDDGLEYISFAIDQAEKSGNQEELIKSSYFAAAAHLLHGNLSRADQLIQKAEKTAHNLGWSEWAKRSQFLQGRIYFESGYYQKALDLFRSLEEKLVPENGGDMLAAWIYRATVFLQAVSRRKETIPGLDVSNADYRLFAVEAAFLLGNYEEAEKLGQEFLSAPAEAEGEDFFFTEQPDWRSGFAQCEYMLLPKRVLHTRLVTVYHTLAQSYLSRSRPGGEDLQNRMQRLMRNELLNEGDINGVFYHYALYLILKETGAPHRDASTAVSMAFKRLQRRSACIDNEQRRRDFISLNYWNGALNLAAREYKLI